MSTPNALSAGNGRSLNSGGLAGHPQGLATLFFTELFERFSYYGMRGILTLYMVAAVAEGGLGLSASAAAFIYGAYIMGAYLTCIPGGVLADRVLGARRAVLLGAAVIAMGHFCLAVDNIGFFISGLILIVLGTGLLKPNVSTMLGSLYGKDDPRRDSGFSIFYMGINLGAAIAPIVCGFLAQSQEFQGWLRSLGLDPHSSWHWGFAAAGVGMLIGLSVFASRHRIFAHVGDPPARIAAGQEVQPLTRQEWGRIGAIAVLFFFTVLFWAVMEQSGASLSLFAKELCNTSLWGWEMPSSWLQSLNPLFIILLAPVLSIIWKRLGERQPSSPVKFTIGLVFAGLGIALMVPASLLAAAGKVSFLWLVAVYLVQVVGELCLSPIGLSTVTRLAPARYVGLMMGVWFLAASLGGMAAGVLSSFFNSGDPRFAALLFGGMAASLLAAAALLVLLTPTVKRLMGGVH